MLACLAILKSAFKAVGLLWLRASNFLSQASEATSEAISCQAPRTALSARNCITFLKTATIKWTETVNLYCGKYGSRAFAHAAGSSFSTIRFLQWSTGSQLHPPYAHSGPGEISEHSSGFSQIVKWSSDQNLTYPCQKSFTADQA